MASYFDTEDDEWDRRQQKKYMQGMNKFLSQERSGENEALLNAVQGEPFEVRGRMVLARYEPIMWNLHDRPVGKFGTVNKMDELECFCRAFRFGWKLWPDSWVGILCMLDYFAEKFLPEDIALLDSETLETIKQIAKTKVWPNNRFGGPTQAAVAKTILARHSRCASFEEASTIDAVRRMAPFNCMSDVDGMSKLIASMSMPPAQPERRKPTQFDFDQRRLCDSALCTNVEQGIIKFKKCSKCMQVAYCSKECQIADWKGHKKQCSNASSKCYVQLL
jgi:hypothetical protein